MYRLLIIFVACLTPTLASAKLPSGSPTGHRQSLVMQIVFNARVGLERLKRLNLPELKNENLRHLGTLIETSPIQIIDPLPAQHNRRLALDPTACFSSESNHPSRTTFWKVFREVMISSESGGETRLVVNPILAPDIKQYLDTVYFMKECLEFQKIPQAHLTQEALLQATSIYTFLKSMNLERGVPERVFLRLLSSTNP